MIPPKGPTISHDLESDGLWLITFEIDMMVSAPDAGQAIEQANRSLVPLATDVRMMGIKTLRPAPKPATE